jgi:hypothetical protein
MPQKPNYSGAASTTAIVDQNGDPVAQQTNNADGSRFSRSLGAPSIATGQVAVGTTATPIVPARAGRLSVTITATSAVVFYVGASGVTAANGHYVAAAAGASVRVDTAGSVFAVGASALTVSYLETF